MTFGEEVGLLFGSFVLLAFLGVLALIVSDLVRNASMPGPAKATWVVLFLFVPVLSVLGYVIVNGQAMADRTFHPRTAR